jgi:adenine-specific DNA-methyltransferase
MTNTGTVSNNADELQAIIDAQAERLRALDATIKDQERLLAIGHHLGLAYNTIPEHGDAQRLLNGEVPVLTADDAHSTVKTGASEDDHVLIEGDNLTALTMLQATHKGKVNVIYIDPPYNTGNHDFVYNDRFVDPEDSYRHSKWLSFMRPRLVLARELLTSDGVIFVSIDDHEQAYLRVLMDEVFGEQNFIANIKWRKTVKPSGNTSSRKLIDRQYEYVLCFAKSIDSVSFNPYYFSQKELKAKGYTHKDEYFNERGYYKLTPLWHSNSGSSFAYQESLDYPVKAPDGSTITIWRNDEKPRNRWMCYTWGKKAFDNGNSLGFIEFVKEKNGKWSLYRKMYTKVKFDPKNGSVVNLPSNVAYTDYYDESTTDTSAALNNALGIDFNFTKPIELIQHLLRIASSKSSTVLDFFAGSGTTGQAVAELNKEDGGHRRAILVTNNYEQDGAENGIARSVTAVRMRRVLTGEDWADGKKHDPLPGNLRYYRIGFKALSDDADVFTGAFTAPGDIAGVIALAHGTHDVVSAESLTAACPALAAAVVNGRAMVLTNGHGDRVLVYSDAVAVMNGADEYEDVLAEFREWAGDAGIVYLASLDESDDDGIVYPLPYVRTVRRTVNGLERQGLLAREK